VVLGSHKNSRWRQSTLQNIFKISGEYVSFIDVSQKTPHEVWSCKNPSVSHLKVFGCDAFVHVPKEKRSKLYKKVVKCIFIGYKEGMKDISFGILHQGKQCTFEKWSSEKSEVSLSLRNLLRPRII
jgi:hypothetical protein